MYLRTTERRNKDGSVVRYLALAHNQRVGATTKANVLLNLGREDRLDPDGLRRLVRSINRYLGEPGTDAGTDAAESAGAGTAAEGLRLIASRPAGAAWLLNGLWKALDVEAALRKVLGGRRFTTDVERVLFALVANRAIDPSSKLAAAEWVGHDVAIPGLDALSEDQAYRAMDLLIEADTDAKVQEAVFFAVADLLNLEVDLLFFDTTSTYFERDTEDPDPAEGTDSSTDSSVDGSDAVASPGGPGGFRRYGHSKDHRRDLPQIVIGLAVTREGIPVRCWCWPGNTNDQAILPQVKDDLRGWRLGRVVTVVDRGFSSRDNLAYLQRAGGHYIAGERMRDGSPHAAQALSRQGRYQQVRDNLRVKEVRIDSTPGVRWIICHNPDEAERDQAAREAAIARISAELDRIASARTRAREAARTRRAATTTSKAAWRHAARAAEREEAAHVKAECALREPPALGRWLRQTPSGRLQLDRTKIAAEAKLDGKYLLSTSDPDLSAEDVALGYKNLLEAERGFRDLKSTIELRPVFHRLELRIRAHVLLCWLALLLIRVAERRTGRTWRTISRELGRLHTITLTGPAGTVVQTTELTTTQAGILRACGVTPPPRITTLDPA
ncbi:IS1634 family transposase [Pseudonocardia sp. ICBG1142]|uniref:IS1634 family transposase n=1 Tax=Pseudonocardia sp. ICBG1142 TaxID=2846760 RepID=UPI001CF6E9F7|nr:IS1634 family transposase [Pseudonocardia sp. ICBG1142]